MNDFLAKYGPWALVAGASEGLGEAFADRLAQRGLNLVLVARRNNLLRKVAERIRQAYRVEVRPVAADLADPDLAARVANVTRERDDDKRCAGKYGALWDEYRKVVPWRIIPRVC